MKKILITLGIVLTVAFGSWVAFASSSPADIVAYFSGVESAASGLIPVGNGSVYVARSMSGAVSINAAGVTSISNTSNGDSANYAPRIAQATYDFSVQGGTVAAHGLGISLPANAVIMNSLMEVVTPIVSVSNNGTFAISCEDANNIFTATDIDSSSAGDILKGTALPSAPVGHIASACEITATIGTNAFTAGKVIVWVEYVVGQ